MEIADSMWLFWLNFNQICNDLVSHFIEVHQKFLLSTFKITDIKKDSIELYRVSQKKYPLVR